MAAIRRVCDDTPRPIREVNRDIPDWLAAIIDRLLAKNPDERFQSAEEVAKLLSDHLAHFGGRRRASAQIGYRVITTGARPRFRRGAISYGWLPPCC